jgi:anti-sigma regulatory factor (Ser/Thr protein kinase)
MADEKWTRARSERDAGGLRAVLEPVRPEPADDDMAVLHDQEYPAEIDAVWVARLAAERAARAAGMSLSQLPNLRLAVSEAVTNAVVHAYAGTRKDGFRLTVMQDGPEIDVLVRDRGSGLRPRSDSRGAGLGLPVIAQVADGLDISSDRWGTRVSMRFGLHPAALG